MNHKVSRIVTITLAIAATVAIGGVAWLCLTRSGPAQRLTSAALPQSLAYQPTSQPAADDPWAAMAAIGPEVPLVDRDPGGLPAPPAARRLSTAHSQALGVTWEVGRYLATATPEVLESFYTDSLERLHWRALGRGRTGDLMFGRASDLCTLRVSRATSRPEIEFSVVVQTRARP